MIYRKVTISDTSTALKDVNGEDYGENGENYGKRRLKKKRRRMEILIWNLLMLL